MVDLWHRNDGRPTTANQLGINDVNFFRTMCDYAVTNLSVDATKIYATGMFEWWIYGITTWLRIK